MGILGTSDALKLAKSKNLDLVLIVPDARPPVCKIINYGKFRYQLNKKEKENRKAGLKAGVVKELKLSSKISEHDFLVRVRQAKNFLEKGYKVSVGVYFRGRELSHSEIGLRLLMRFTEEVAGEGLVERKPHLEGRNLSLILAPIPGGKRKNAQDKNQEISSKTV